MEQPQRWAEYSEHGPERQQLNSSLREDDAKLLPQQQVGLVCKKCRRDQDSMGIDIEGLSSHVPPKANVSKFYSTHETLAHPAQPPLSATCRRCACAAGPSLLRCCTSSLTCSISALACSWSGCTGTHSSEVLAGQALYQQQGHKRLTWRCRQRCMFSRASSGCSRLSVGTKTCLCCVCDGCCCCCGLHLAHV